MGLFLLSELPVRSAISLKAALNLVLGFKFTTINPSFTTVSYYTLGSLRFESAMCPLVWQLQIRFPSQFRYGGAKRAFSHKWFWVDTREVGLEKEWLGKLLKHYLQCDHVHSRESHLPLTRGEISESWSHMTGS